MGYSAKIKIDRKRPRKDGAAAIFLQVIIDRKKARIDLDIAWPAERFNELAGCRSRRRRDPDMEEYNVIIRNAQAKANNIHKDYLIRGIHLTLESFLKEYRSNLNKSDFIQYFAQKSFQRWNKQLIGDGTYEKEKGTIKRLSEFCSILPFHEFHASWAQEFDNYLKKIGNDHNTRWARHKHIKTYLNMAKGIDRINFNDPYARFRHKLQEGNWKPLELDELKSLLEKYLKWKDKPLPLLPRKNGTNQLDQRPGLTRAEVIVLRRFLFSCNCALRISDLQDLDSTMFNNGQMSITPKKTEKYGSKIVSVPLNDIARMMLDDELHDRTESLKIFDRYCDQSANRLLKRIAAKAGISVNLHNHVARYTFASLYDQAGGNHTSLMKYMGIAKRETLNKYVKNSDKVLQADIEKMNDYLG
jgi:integrase/recombinase XerD